MKNRFLCIGVLLALLCISCHKDESKQQVAGEVYVPQSIEDFKGKTVAVILGTVQDIYLSERVPEANLFRVATPADVLTALETDNCDYALIDSSMLIGADVEKRGIRFAFNEYVGASDVAFAFNKSNRALCDSINAVMQQMKDDGIWGDFIERWTIGSIDYMKIPDDIPTYTEGEPIRVATMSDSPFSFVRDGKWTGMELELVYRLAARLHRPVQADNYEFAAMIPAVNTNRVDIICSGLFITPERAEKVLFSEPYFKGKTSCFYHTSSESVAKVSVIDRTRQSWQDNLIEEDRWRLLVDGFGCTILITILSIVLGTLLGAGVCWMRMNRHKWVSSIAKVYISLFQGIPILVILMLMFYVVFASTSLTAITVAVITFSLNFAAYVSEMFRASISGIDRGQTEAGLAMGFSPAKTFIHFIMPQAVRKVIPLFRGEAISLLKNTSIVGYIAIQDMTKVSDIIRSRTFDAFFPLIIVSIIYFILAWLMTQGLNLLFKERSVK